MLRTHSGTLFGVTKTEGDGGLQEGEDFRKRNMPTSINGTTMERVSSFRFLQFTSERTCPGLTTLTSSQRNQTAALLPLQLLQVHHREDPDWLHHRLPSMEDLYTQLCRKKADRIIKDPDPPRLKTVLPAVVWPTVRQHPGLLYQTQRQLHPPGQDTFELHLTCTI
ncbi:hypothetical protein L3Q82_021074 [Scortum barcoo]|uniref:Uncharacterized protein n=1 Tax=Scortum barcoo TaxID=214431 RepID=A0ACB8X4E3_9TELE|nr:hypothetical protein L3Q82_021074 [Scortum barcoo]